MGLEKLNFEKERLIDLAVWFPKLKEGIEACECSIKLPETHIIKTDADLLRLFETDLKPIEGYDKLLTDIDTAAQKVGYPFFLRTGYTSGKHYFTDTCYVSKPEDIQKSVRNLVEYGEMTSFIGLPFDTWVVRELLPVTPAFIAFKGLPITTEIRYFVLSGEVKYSVPYWPVDAIKRPSCEDWEDKLFEANTLNDEDKQLLDEQTQIVACIFEDSDGWSVDWVKTDKGWYLIDMALSYRSWGYNPEKMK